MNTKIIWKWMQRLAVVGVFGLAACGNEGLHTSNENAAAEPASQPETIELAPSLHSPKMAMATTNLIATTNTGSPLGTNLQWIAYSETDRPLIDEMKRSSSWIVSSDPACGATLQEDFEASLDENGWPQSLPVHPTLFHCQVVTKLLFYGAEGRYPAGQYVVLYEGEGLIDYDGDAVKREDLSTAGRDVFEVANPTDQGIFLSLIFSNPNNNGEHLRNIRVIHPGGICNGDRFTYHPDSSTCQNSGDVYTSFEQAHTTQNFHPLYLNELRGYRSLRFLNYFQTVDNIGELSWEDRPKMSDAEWTSLDGVPLELMAELATELNADAWLNIPVRATNEYLELMAVLFRENLPRHLKVYVEYHNEIWNPDPEYAVAGQWIEDQGKAAWPNSTATDYDKRMNWYGKRSVEICDLWKGVWSEFPERVQCVIAGTPTPSEGNTALACPLWAAENGGASCASQVDAYATNGYFGFYLTLPQFHSQIRSWMQDVDGGLSKLFQELSTGGLLYDPNMHADLRAPETGAMSESHDIMLGNALVAQSHQLPLVAYEGGQSLVFFGEDPALADIERLFEAANKDPRMAQLYSQQFNTWRNLGGEMFMHFLPVDRRGFGLKDFQDQLPNPKHQTVMDYLINTQCWWTGCN